MKNSNHDPEKLLASEKEKSIQFIMSQVSLKPKNFYQFIVTFFELIDFRLVFWGLRDVFLLLLIGIACLLVLFVGVVHRQIPITTLFDRSLDNFAYLYVFLSAPCLFSLLHYLSIWKEVQQKTFELKMTLKISLKELMIVRTLLISGISIFSSVLLSFFVWFMFSQEISLLKLISVSSASLFLFATAQLLLDQVIPVNLNFKISPIIWLLVGILLISNGKSVANIIIVLPDILFFVLTILFMISFISILRYRFNQEQEGVISHVRV